MAPFADNPGVRYILASKVAPDQELLRINAPNVTAVSHESASSAAFIDYLYSLKGDLLFFPLASKKYVRSGPAKIVGVDYGMEDFYSRDYIAPQSVQDMLSWHEFAMSRYTGIVTVSETSRKDLSWFFPQYKDKVRVVYPGSIRVAPATEKDMPEALRGATYFLIIGYEHKKNITRVTKAYDAFKKETGSKTKLAIAGTPGFGSEAIDTHINRLSSRHDIVRLGYIPAPLKQLLIDRCHALVALPIYEGFGISALEGMAAGKVVLVSDNGSLKEVVGDAGYVADPFLVPAMARQFAVIDALKDNPKKQHIPGRLAVFDQAVQAKRLLEYLAELAA